jgi:twinkle protein
MKSAREILDDMHIKHRGKTSGNFKTTCPHCSHTRKRKSDPCLSVRVDDSGVGVRCHNCGFTDGEFYDGTERRTGHNFGKVAPKVTYGGLLAKARHNWLTRPGH